jgi:hypothetical protein
MNVKMVEIGIGILRTEAKDNNAVMRSWAIDSIERSTGRKFTDEQRAALLNKALPIAAALGPEATKAIIQQTLDRFLDDNTPPANRR